MIKPEIKKQNRPKKLIIKNSKSENLLAGKEYEVESWYYSFAEHGLYPVVTGEDGNNIIPFRHVARSEYV